MVANSQVKALYEGIVGELNRSLAPYGTVRKTLLAPDEFTATDGTLTPTMKVRIKAIEGRYREQIEEPYNEAETPSVA